MVQLDCLAVAFVGAPNIGKLSIIRVIRSITPKVNIYHFTMCGIMLRHLRIFWGLEREVALGNVAGISIPSERQLIQEHLVKSCKDKGGGGAASAICTSSN